MASNIHSQMRCRCCAYQVQRCACVVLSLGLGLGLIIMAYFSDIKINEFPLIPVTEQLNEMYSKVVPTEETLQIPQDLGFSVEEWARIQKAMHWGGPAHQVTNLEMTTSPYRSTFIIENFKDSYYVGDKLFATIIAKDFMGRPKTYGGDFFQAKVYSEKLKASVFGEVLDHQNGTYTAQFSVPWAGQALVSVRLIHSSEGVEIIKRNRDTDPNLIDFYGYFEGKDPQGAPLEERVVCNAKWPGVELGGKGDCCCEYPDAKTGLTWYCRKPPTLPCSSFVYHSFANLKNQRTHLENTIMGQKYLNRVITGDSRVITVLSSNFTKGARDTCKPGMHTPIPAGFYMQDIWTSFVCATRHFDTADATQCLKDKHIYIMGDSTSRQWFYFLIQTVPTLKQMNLHTEGRVGPHMAVDAQNNIDLYYRSHGLPRRCGKVPVTNLHYISNEIDGMAGGPHTVIVLNVWSHFIFLPLSYYAYRVSLIRRAVLALLARAPQTKVIIKTANTARKDFVGRDWLSLQLDKILRETFRDVGVYILDVWQMTACHYSIENIHPVPEVVSNEVDILLSFICPK